ncbi:MAG: YDR127Wp-like protein, partial [Olpidium bornovanus]
MADGEGAARGAAFETTFVLGRPSLLTGYGLVGKGGCFARDVLANVPASTYVVFTDANLADLGHLESLVRSLREESAAVRAAGEPEPRVLEYVLPPGEESKSRRAKEECEDFLLASACSRDTCLVALGGGVVGDLVGFVAATFMRGVRYVQVPTTLLAMVDSAIGGKTAVDTPRGKNLIGAFWQPERIFADLSFLKTLPPRESANGMAEGIKTAAFWDEKMFTTLESEVESITEGATSDDASCRKLLHDVILAAARVKAHVVTVDERETGLRGLLNFGHTVGHAYEALLFPALLHGECVSIGMVKEAEIARRLGHLHQAAVSRLVRCLRAYGLPVTIDDERVAGLTGGKRCAVEDLMRTMDVDKKNCGSRKKVVLLAGIGKTVEQRASFVPDDCIRNVLSPAVVVRPPSTSERPRPPDVVICTPGSKSVSNRALLLASLGTGTCRLKGLLHSDDTQVMLDALRRLGGSSYSWEDGGDTLVVTGCGGKFHVPDRELYLGNAGTAARFVTTVCALVEPAPAGSLHTATVLTGNARMKQRPIGPLVDALRENGQQVEYLQSESCLPIRVIPSHQGLAGGEIRLEASISSQYVSSILMCAPYARESVVLR